MYLSPEETAVVKKILDAVTVALTVTKDQRGFKGLPFVYLTPFQKSAVENVLMKINNKLCGMVVMAKKHNLKQALFLARLERDFTQGIKTSTDEEEKRDFREALDVIRDMKSNLGIAR